MATTTTTTSAAWETLATSPALRRLRRNKREELDEGNLLQSAVLRHGWTVNTPVAAAGNTNDNQRSRKDHRRDTVTSFVKQQAEAMMTGACDGTLAFQLEVRPSGIAGGGDGLFLGTATRHNQQGGVTVQRGQAVTLYGGRVFLKGEMDHFGGIGALVARIQEGQRSHILGKAGGDCVDGFTHAGLSVTEKEVADSPALLCALKERSRSQQQQSYRSPANQPFPFALGHMSNHCPNGQAPNLVGWGVNYDLDFLQGELRRGQFDAPNTFALELAGSGGDLYPTPLPCPSTIVMMATCDIQAGEELFQDYGFEHSPPAPPWFQPAGLLHDLGNPPDDDDDDDDKMHAAVEKSRGCEADAAKGALADWKATFMEMHGRSPNRKDMDGDPIAKSLFEVFRRK